MPKVFHPSLFSEVRDYIIITLGLIGYALGFTCFQLPFQIPSGGVTGAAAIVFYATGFPVQYTFFLINIVLLIAAVKTLGWKFCIKTIYAVFMLTFFLGLAREIVLEYAAQHPELPVSPQGMPQFVGEAFMSCIIGAGLQGMSIAFVFLNNGSTGGTDIIAAIVNKYKDISLGTMIMLCDLLIISSSMLIPGFTISNLIYGYCTLIISSFMVDYVVDRGRQSVQFFIFSKRYEIIAEMISQTHRGVTVVNGMGWYTKAENKLLIVMAKKRESTNIFRIIQTIDPEAFVTQTKVIGVFGKGFDRIKVKAAKEEAQTTPKQ